MIVRGSSINPSSFMRVDSYNPGIEKLSEKALGTGIIKKEKNFRKHKKKQDLEMQTYIKLTSTSEHDFHTKWAMLILIVNLYNIFTATYFLGIKGFPSSIWLAIELSFEIILLCDYISRWILKNLEVWSRMWMLHEKSTYLHNICLFISSIPYSFFSLIMSVNLDGWGVAIVRILKTLRFFQFFTFFENQEILLKKASGGFLMKVCKYLILLLVIFQSTGMLLLVVGRIEVEKNNPYNWLQPWIDGDAQTYEIYTDAFYWAASMISRISYNSPIPNTAGEKVISALIMILGVFTCAFICGLIVHMLITVKAKDFETEQKLERAKKWCRLRHINSHLKVRILAYYYFVRTQFSHFIDWGFLDELPLSLKSEISVSIHSDMIPKVAIFEMADPSFVLSIVRCLTPKVFMAGDYIIRQGDYAEELFFIKIGTVEVIAADSETIIAYLEEGDYFGEIGVLLDQRRSLSVRSYNATMISSISKNDLMPVLQNYPEYHEFLKNVAEQRLKTTNTEDIDYLCDLQVDESDSDSSDSSDENTDPSFGTHIDHSEKTCIQRFISVAKTNDVQGSYIIDPFSQFFYIWLLTISISFGFYLFYVPFIIAFEYPDFDLWLSFDVIAYVIYIVDIAVCSNTSLYTEHGTYNSDIDAIRRNYLENYLLMDIISSVPIDFLLIAFDAPRYAAAFFKLVRFFKAKRIWNLLGFLQQHMKSSIILITLIESITLVIYYAHYVACISFYLAKLQYWINPNTRFNKENFINQFALNNYYNPDDTILDIPIFDQYVNLLYFGYSIVTLGVYGDIPVCTTAEKVLSMIFLIVSTILEAFLISRAWNLATNYHKNHTEHLAKVSIIKQWMSHCKLSKDLQQRVLNYYNLLWTKLQGCDDEEILLDLPESLRTDIRYFLFAGLTKSGFFPEDEKGAILSIIRRCKLSMVCGGERIVTEGELGLEMYFILEGEVEIVSSTGFVFNTLGSGMVFGEIALLKIVPSVRSATVRAKIDTTLAILSMSDFNFVMNNYPDFSQKVRKIAAERERMNRVTMQNNSMKALVTYVNDSETLKFTSLENKEEEKPKDISNDQDENNATQDNMETKIFPNGDVPVYVFQFNPLLVKFHSYRWKQFVYFIVNFYNFVWMPLQIAFEYKYEHWSISLEICSMVIYLIFGMYYWMLYDVISKCPHSAVKKKFPNVKPKTAFWKSVHNFVLFLPFAMIFSLSETPEPRWIISILSIIRISGIYCVVEVFDYLKHRMKYFIFFRFFEVAVIYFMANHLCACFFIEIGRSEDTVHSWFYKIYLSKSNFSVHDSLSNSTILVHAYHWASMVVSHVGYGYITSVSPWEKVYNCFMFLLGFFVFIVLFGSICSLFKELISNRRYKLKDNYEYVRDFIKKKKVDQQFMKQINDYFNYLWKANKGIIDQDILKHLTPTLMSDIQLYRYREAVQNSQLFRKKDGKIHEQLARTMFRLCHTEFYLIGDPIMHGGERNNDFFIMLDGEADIIDIRGKANVKTLKTGDHFGEVGSFIPEIPVRTASAVAIKICQVARLKADQLEMLMDAFPEWYESMQKLAENRIKETFCAESIEEAIAKFDKIAKKISNDPSTAKKYQKRTEKLMAPKISKILSIEPSNRWMNLTLLHMATLIYTAFALPLEVCFNIKLNYFLYIMEVICVSESIVFFAIITKYTIFSRKKKNDEEMDIEHHKHFIIFDILGMSPFNLIFDMMRIEHPFYLIILLRLLRIASVFRLQSLFSKMEMQWRHISFILNCIKATVIAVIFIHWLSCLWYFMNWQEDGYSWAESNHLEDSTTWNKTSFSYFYILNILTLTGYSFMQEANDTERVVTIFLIFIGDMLIAMLFGFMATVIESHKSELQDYINKLNSPFSVTNKSEKSEQLMKKLKSFYAFSTSLSQVHGPIDFNQLYMYLPSNIVNSIIYECNRPVLKEVTYLQLTDSVELYESLAMLLKPRLFLPEDYIIYHYDFGCEMFFIIEGSAEIRSIDGKKTIKTLTKGSVVGDIELITDEKPFYSVVAKTLCLSYFVGKTDFHKLVIQFPDISEQIKLETEKLRRERTDLNVIIEQDSYIEEDGSPLVNSQDIINSMTIYKLVNFPIIQEASDTNWIGAYSGLKNLNSQTIKKPGTLAITKKSSKRRPHYSKEHKRRFSREFIGKEIMISELSSISIKTDKP
ncbi:unnamed protein product [Blepharisma stoltei]|uniref:Cyclic nucleotide-binding domain-containing protein n=1 Tax=Blepharisma stoltei TaxID=1481888 RepID=A0AAU9J1N7_9CILI|nr:unnamed protein product [Blepharisma stoltei]